MTDGPEEIDTGSQECPWRTSVTRAVTVQFGRPWSLLFIAIPVVVALIVHGWWLPRKGINGLTGEPRARYYELRGWKLPPSQ